MKLEAIAENAVGYAAMLTDVAEAQTSAATLGRLCSDLSRYYRALGIYGLLLNANTEVFFHSLIQSGITRRYYLDRAVKEGVVEDPARRASFIDPFCDAVAADQVRLARQIAALAPTEWMEGEEYEDDFAYARSLFILATQDPAQDPQVRSELDRFAAALEGGASPRFDVCVALLTRDQDAFDEAFTALVAAHEQHYNALANPDEDSVLAQEYTFEANRRIFVEGLAVLRLAEQRGLVTAPEYRLCPAMARDADYPPFQPIAFPEVGLDA